MNTATADAVVKNTNQLLTQGSADGLTLNELYALDPIQFPGGERFATTVCDRENNYEGKGKTPFQAVAQAVTEALNCHAAQQPATGNVLIPHS